MSLSASAPIGVLDSGLGGLTAVRELQALLPQEDIVYFGDTGRVPYGTRGRDIIIAYTRQDIAFLLSRGVKTILAACGTISSTYPPKEAEGLPVGFMGVVQPTANAALAATRSGRVGIIATEATIASESYQRALLRGNASLKVTARACPLFVPLVENGYFAPGNPLATLAAEEYLAPVKAAGVDTLILGCTHYPLLAGVIADYMGEEVTLIDSGKEAAKALRDVLESQGLLRNGAGQAGALAAFVSDDADRFGQLAARFLGRSEALSVRQINIENYTLE